MAVDQAAGLREIKKKERHLNDSNPSPVNVDNYALKPRDVRVISVTSGKGGVGKTNIAANLAYLLSKRNKKALVLDADAGLANIDVILGINSPYNLYHVLKGEKTLAQAIVEG
ncbi:MAG TPA: AAA family ATPase, partial [Smithellaceae bacterium]|nr:AAA family ATPase [Smithellaceae bacterium]